MHNFGKFGGGKAAVVVLSHQTGVLAELQIDFPVRNKHNIFVSFPILIPKLRFKLSVLPDSAT